ncbi:uncharacterized protein LOC116299636 [Actinia tenebrosa]|uniref:Uncharacterized protein LOC116299636 n=1 Tax=Actinia tenebrosa TaxID=6105 RepID=A0A6P8I6J6_ACTTE|nr:uncharacterized protein LOC116299636 [Actinia tenebrosa]
MASLNMQSSCGDKKTSIGQPRDGKDVTLREVINIINATNTKNAPTSSDKTIIQGLTSSSLKERINTNHAFSNNADAMQMSIKMMRKELKEQVKQNKANPKSSRHRLHSSKGKSITSYCYPVSEASWPETIRVAAPTLSRLSSEAESERLVKQSEELSGKDVKWDAESLFSRRSDTESLTNLANQNKNIYSRHLQSNSTETEEDAICFELESSAKDKAAQEYREARRVSSASSVQSLRSDLGPKQAFPSTTKTPLRNRSESQSSQEANDEVAEKLITRNNSKEKIQDEREFVETLTDPTLKTSLQRIIQKRRNSVCLIKSAITGLRVANDDGTFSVIAEENSDLDLESLMAKSDSKISVLSERTIKSSFNSGQKLDRGPREDECAASDWEIKSLKSFRSEASQTSYYQSSIPKRGLVYTQTVSTRKKGVSSGKKFSFCPDKNVRTNKVETEETRIIKPLSSKTYRPCLTATSRAKKRSNTARSSPETSREKNHCVDKGKQDVIREFMLMYAKVKQNKKEAERTVEDNKPVRMISATPEFVVKSAIGQFLSSVFPPEKPRDSSWERERRREDKQRTKLLKIKICMQQLASIA